MYVKLKFIWVKLMFSNTSFIKWKEEEKNNYRKSPTTTLRAHSFVKVSIISYSPASLKKERREKKKMEIIISSFGKINFEFWDINRKILKFNKLIFIRFPNKFFKFLYKITHLRVYVLVKVKKILTNKNAPFSHCERETSRFLTFLS